jgi:hypothetical protein
VTTIYKSVDASAPVLTGQAGTFLNLLDKCLIDGYGSKAAAGWTKEFSGTNRAVYRAPSGLRHYLNVNDTGTTRAPWNGFLTASAVDVGTGMYPVSGSPTQVYKSNTGDTSQRPWLLAADARSIILLIDSYQSNPTLFAGVLHLFGEFYSLKTSDLYRSFCGGENPTSGKLLAAVSGGRLGVARHSSQVGTPILMFIGAHQSLGSQTGAGDTSHWMPGSWPFPNVADSSVHLTRVTVESPTHGLRGYVRGLMATDHTGFSTDLSDLIDVDGASPGVYAGKNFIMVRVRSSFGQAWLALETTTWDNNS